MEIIYLCDGERILCDIGFAYIGMKSGHTKYLCHCRSKPSQPDYSLICWTGHISNHLASLHLQRDITGITGML